MDTFNISYIFSFLFLTRCVSQTVETVQKSFLFKRFEKDRKYSTSLVELEGKSLAECAALCEQEDECLSFNYNKTQKQCHLTDSYPSQGIKDVLIEQVPGWEIYYKENPACEFSYTTHFATETVSTIKSPNYPNNYYSNLDRCWLIIKPTVTSILYLNFTDLEVGYNIACLADHVGVYDGACKDVPMHATLCQTKKVISDSSGLYVLINLKTDATGNRRGFSMNYYIRNN